MGKITAKNIKSKYRYVRGIQTLTNPEKIHWTVKIKGISEKGFKTEKDAAIAVDKILIKNGKKPVNVLIAK